MLYSKLLPEQKKACRFVLRHSGTNLFFDQGTGKTYVTLAVIDEESRDVSNYQAIVVCLKTNLFTTWVKKATDLIPHVNIATDFVTFKTLPFPRVLFINYEQTNNKRLRGQLARVRWTFAAFDEAQRLKKRSSLSSRFARMLRDVPRRMAMSGTPFDKNPTDLWAICQFVDQSLFGDNWKAFFKKYLKKAGFMGYGHKFRSKSLEEKFVDIAAKITLRVSRDILGLKGSGMKKIKFDLDPVQRQFYDRLERDLVVEFDGETEQRIISTPMKATLQMKLHQITGGFIKDDEGEISIVGRSKLRALRDLLEKQTKVPVVVFYVYTEEGNQIERLLRRMYHRVGRIHGKIKDTKRGRFRSDTIDAFQAGELDALAIQQRTGGVGVDLFEGSLGVFYSSTHSWIDFEQAKSRLERHGQKNYVDFFYLMARNSVDEDRYDAVSSKSKLNAVTFRRLQRRNIMALKPKSKDTAKTEAKTDAKATKTTGKDKAVKATKAETKEYKYGVADLQKMLGHGDPASTRVALRKHSIEKAGKSYGWDSKDELEAVVKKIKAGAEKAEPKAKAEPEKKTSKKK